LLKKVTTAEIEAMIKLWLRYAIDRSGDRGARDRSNRNADAERSRSIEVDTDMSD